MQKEIYLQIIGKAEKREGKGVGGREGEGEGDREGVGGGREEGVVSFLSTWNLKESTVKMCGRKDSQCSHC